MTETTIVHCLQESVLSCNGGRRGWFTRFVRNIIRRLFAQGARLDGFYWTEATYKPRGVACKTTGPLGMG